MSMAAQAETAEARLIHYHNAGICSVKAALAQPSLPPIGKPAISASTPPVGQEGEGYHRELEQGAEYLAEIATDPDERVIHLKHAAIYRARARDLAEIAPPGTMH